ncbi:MAG: ATP-binding protein [Bacillota bacterium]
MKTICQSCQPRQEVLEGRVEADIFAAKLSDVMSNTAPDVYGIPQQFFAQTFPTGGLTTLIEEVYGRISGVRSSNNPIIRLETSFGGGKTHSLIALYHLAKHGRNIQGIDQLADPGLIPSNPTDVAAVVGSDMDPQSGIEHEDGIVTYTLWGEIAYQLAGPTGYKIMEENDRSGIAPGTQRLEKLIGNRPTLIMIDEIARYYRAAKGKMVGQDTLAGQTVAFMHTLLEFTASKEKVVVVYTLAEISDAYASETEDLKTALRETSRVSARLEKVLRPTAETEIAAIVKRRLFVQVDESNGAEIAQEFFDYYRKAHEQGVALPQKATRVEYKDELARSYPFHPELLDTLNRKTSTIQNFQKTRGALRLLASVILYLWQQKEVDTYLIHPHHVELTLPIIRDDLTSRLGRDAFTSVIEADIYSEKQDTHVQEIDVDWLSKDKPPLGKRVAQTVFLHSITQGIASGVEPALLNLAVGQPGLDYQFINKAVTDLEKTCWYMEFDGARYRFKTEPSINKIIADETDNYTKAVAKQELATRMKNYYAEKHFKTVFFPEGPEGVEDDTGKPKLVIIHFDSETVNSTQSQAYDDPPALVDRIYQKAGVQQAFRVNQNNLIFLVANSNEVASMIEQARKYKALAALTDKERLKDFTIEQREELKNRAASAELDLKVRVASAYRHLFYPSGEAGAVAGLAQHVLPPQDVGQIHNTNQQDLLLQVLSELSKTLTSQDKPLAAAYAQSKIWTGMKEVMTTEDFRQAFCQKRVLPILFDPEQVKVTIQEGVQKGLWVYYNGQKAFTKESPGGLMVQLTPGHKLYTKEKALQDGILEKPKVAQPEPRGGVTTGTKPPKSVCPLCGQNPCICFDTGGNGGKFHEKKPLVTSGIPNKAFADLRDLCEKEKVEALWSLSLKLKDIKTVQAAALMLPQYQKKNIVIQQDFTVELPDGSLEFKFSGGWLNYREVKNFTERMAKLAKEMYIQTIVKFEFPEMVSPTGEELSKINESLNNFKVEKIEIQAKETKGE